MNSTTFDSMPTITLVLTTFKIVLNLFGFSINCFLFWILLHDECKLHKTFRILLGYTLLNDILISATILLTIRRTIQCHNAVLMVYYGPCTWISGGFCRFLFSIHWHSLENWIFSQILLIAFRTAMLTSAKFISISKTILFCFLAWLPGLICLILHQLYIYNPSRLLSLIGQCYDEDFSKNTVSGYESFSKSPIFITFISLLLPNIPHYFLALWFRHKQNNVLKQRTLSTTTLRMHSTLRRVSTLKAFLPLLLLIDVLIYFFCQMEILPSQFTEYFLGTVSSSINVVNPIIVIICFRQCRRQIKNCFSNLFTPSKRFWDSTNNSLECEKVDV